MRRHFLAIAVILTVPTGCDNVAWGGVDLTVESPATDRTEGGDATGSAPDLATGEADTVDPQGRPLVGVTVQAPPPSAAGPTGPTGTEPVIDVQPSDPSADLPADPPAGPPAAEASPVLLAGIRSGDGYLLSPVGLVTGGRLAPLPAPGTPGAPGVQAALAPGTEWVLFASGARIGSARAVRTTPSPELCGWTTSVVASGDQFPQGTAPERVLALASPASGIRVAPAYRPLQHQYEQRFASLELGRAAIPRVGAPWPPDGMIPVRRDIRSFQPLGDPAPSFAVSFVVRDTLDVSSPGPDAYALFLIGAPTGPGFEERYLWYRAAADGKAAPQLFDHLDLDGDGRGEVLLEVFGQGRRGFVGLSREATGAWREVFRSPCPHLTERGVG